MKIINGVIAAGTGAGFALVPVPANMTVLGFDVTPDAVTGSESTVTIENGTLVMGTAVVAADTAKGEIINGVMSSTLATRKGLLTKAVPLEVAVDARTNSTEIYFSVYLDEFALNKD